VIVAIQIDVAKNGKAAEANSMAPPQSCQRVKPGTARPAAAGVLVCFECA
jgi:hypothetical protein